MLEDDMIDEMEDEAARAIADYDGVELTELGLRALEAEEEIARLTASLKLAKKGLDKLMMYAIPAALHEAGIPEFGFETPDGRTPRMKLDTKIRGSIRYAKDLDAAVAYLEANGHEGVIKSTLQIDFTRDEIDEVGEGIAKSIEALTQKYPTITQDVHAQTLAAIGRSALTNDPTFDLGMIGLTAVPSTKFTKR